MLSKAKIRFITSLQHKKFRKQHQLFIVEGVKSILEFIAADYQIHSIYTTEEAQAKMGNLREKLKCVILTPAELQKISGLTHPQGVLALVYLPCTKTFDWTSMRQQHILVLDDVQDPGNLGTIVRTAEWFGIQHIICSVGTVDAFNPKVVQATMGSLARVNMYYTELVPFILESAMPTFGALLSGKSVYETDFGHSGLIVVGNEGNGISPEVVTKVDQAVTIPRIGNAESLNVAVAATVFCSEIARRKLDHGISFPFAR